MLALSPSSLARLCNSAYFMESKSMFLLLESREKKPKQNSLTSNNVSTHLDSVAAPPDGWNLPDSNRGACALWVATPETRMCLGASADTFFLGFSLKKNKPPVVCRVIFFISPCGL